MKTMEKARFQTCLNLMRGSSTANLHHPNYEHMWVDFLVILYGSCCQLDYFRDSDISLFFPADNDRLCVCSFKFKTSHEVRVKILIPEFHYLLLLEHLNGALKGMNPSDLIWHLTSAKSASGHFRLSTKAVSRCYSSFHELCKLS